MLQIPRNRAQPWLSAALTTTSRSRAFVGLMVAVGVTYFLAARLSLFLLTKPDGVAVFWPAAGVSVGVLIALGRAARWPVAVGAIAATVVANLLGDRNLSSATIFGLCNAGEAIFASWLIERRFGPRFHLDRLSHVLGFLAASIVAPAISGICGTLGYVLFHSSSASIPIIWYHWFASDALGIIAVAPLLIGLGSALRNRPPRSDFINGIGPLVAVTALSGLVTLPARGPWTIAVPVALVFPVLLWLAARCQPVFASGAAFIATLAIVWATTFGSGPSGDLGASIDDRILSAQASILAVSICAFVLAALFAERREHEARLSESEARLQEALAAGGVAAFDLDMSTGVWQGSESATHILGFDPQRTVTATWFLERIHPDDRARFRELVSGVSLDNPSYSVSFRFIRPDGREVWLEETSKAEFDATGRVLRIKGLTLDITERRRAEADLRDREDRMRAIVNTVQNGIVTIDDKGIIENLNPAAARIFGYTPKEAIGRNVNMLMSNPFRDAHDSYLKNYVDTGRAKVIGIEREVPGLRSDGSTFPMELTVSEIAVAGRRMFVGVVHDITNRTRNAERQKKLMAELDHRVKNVLARVAVVAESTSKGSKSIEEFVHSFSGRIQSMALSHSLLSQSGWQSVGLSSLVHNQLAPYATNSNVTIAGTDVMLSAEEIHALALVLHELVTNAAKYGALSSPNGRVSVSWARRSNGDGAAILMLVWQESGGPPVAAKMGSGYGTSLIRDLIPHELGGTIDLAFAPDGVKCKIGIPLEP
jgi:PAS domain S-box-containing protein